MKQRHLTGVEREWAWAHVVNAPHGLRVLERLKRDPRVPDALDAITSDPKKLRAIFLCCMEAEQLFRTFHVRVRAERRMKDRTRTLKSKVDEIRQFVDEATRLPDTVGGIIGVRARTISAIENSLAAIDGIIDARYDLVERNLVCWGVTRKAQNKAAATMAAVGWIAATVKHVAGGRPMVAQAAVLSEAALGLPDVVSPDQVRRAERNVRAAVRWAERETERRIREKNIDRTRH